MRRWIAGSGLALAVVAAVPLTGLAQKSAAEGKTETYKIDPIHSSMWFRIRHMEPANFYGRFNEIAGEFVLNEADPAACRIAVEVKASSVDTNNKDRDTHLRSDEFFDVAKHPVIRFESEAFKKTGEGAYEVRGRLSLHGETKPLTVTLKKTGQALDPRGDFRTGLETTFTIKRSDFGMTTMIGPLGDDVTLTVSLEGIRQ